MSYEGLHEGLKVMKLLKVCKLCVIVVHYCYQFLSFFLFKNVLWYQVFSIYLFALGYESSATKPALRTYTWCSIIKETPSFQRHNLDNMWSGQCGGYCWVKCYRNLHNLYCHSVTSDVVILTPSQCHNYRALCYCHRITFDHINNK